MTELPTEPVQRLIGKYEQRISKLEDVNGKLCAEINRQERVIERQAELIANRDESIHNLVKVLDKRQERIKALESLLVDVWPYVWALRIPGRRDEEFEARFKELGLEVES